MVIWLAQRFVKDTEVEFARRRDYLVPRPVRMAASEGKIRHVAGVLITCDPPMKQYILYVQEKEKIKFIQDSMDSDSTHLLVFENSVDMIKSKIAQYIDEQNMDTDSKKERKKN